MVTTKKEVKKATETGRWKSLVRLYFPYCGSGLRF